MAEGLLDKKHIVEPLEAKREDLLVVFIIVQVVTYLAIFNIYVCMA